MTPLNILVADLTHTSAFFLCSLMRATGHRVSLAFAPDEAIAKVETGLFDAVLLDAELTEASAAGLVARVAELCPGLPILAVAEPGAVVPEGLDIFAVIPKPLRLTRVHACLGKVAAHVAALCEKRRHFRRTVDMPVEVAVGSRRLAARAVNLSLGGIQIDAGGLSAWGLLAAGKPLAVRLALAEGAAAVEVPAQLAYVDGQGDAPEQVGLAFPSLPTRARASLERFLTAA